jgi:hypothetical protein
MRQLPVGWLGGFGASGRGPVIRKVNAASAASSAPGPSAAGVVAAAARRILGFPGQFQAGRRGEMRRLSPGPADFVAMQPGRVPRVGPARACDVP